MSGDKPQSIQAQAIDLLYKKGPMSVRDLKDYIPYKYKSIESEMYRLAGRGLVDKDEDSIWHLREGVTPETLKTGEMEVTTEETEKEATKKTKEKETSAGKGASAPLDQRDLFIKQLTDIGVKPKETIPTIADVFFSGDIEDLDWLHRVLRRTAAGIVTPTQHRLMMEWWSRTRGLPFREEDWAPGDEGGGKSRKEAARGAKGEEKAEKRLDPGMGWQVGRDRDGAWIALPGGPMSYQEAVDAAERRALIDSYKHGSSDDEDEGPAEGAEGKPARKVSRPQESLVEKMVLKMMDKMLDGGGAGQSQADARVEALQAEMERMREDRQEERFERMEGLIADVASRDPWSDTERLERAMRQRGWGPNVVTDQSPAVQLLKDSTDKLDKNVGRLMGIIERAALRSEEFTPESTRSPGAREQKAEELLTQAHGRDRSRSLRRETFGF